MQTVAIKRLDELENRSPAYALVAGVDLVVIRLCDRRPVPPIEDLTTFKTDIAQLTGVEYGGVAPIIQRD